MSGGVQLRRVAVVTRDRPQLALRCLESYAQAARAAGRELELAVYDDSSDEAAGEGFRDSLKRLARRFGADARYAGPAEKRRFAAELGRTVGREVAEFALLPAGFGPAPTIGANRNAVALDAAGGAVFMTDDDALSVAADVPGREEGARCVSGVAGFEHWFYPDRAGTLAACPAEPADLLGWHERSLGLPAEALLPGCGWPRGRAVVSLNGYLGDGASSSRSYLHLEGGSRERLLRSEDTFWRAVRRREECRGVRRLTLSRGAYFMGAFAGLDLSQPLPPFPPVGRAEDAAFGALRWALRPDDFAVILPVAALHDPQPARAYPDDELTGAGLIVNDVVAAAVLARGRCSAAELGRELGEAAGGPARFGRWLASVLEPRYRRRVEDLEALRRDFPQAPAFWRAQVERALERWTAALRAKSFAVGDMGGEEEARVFVGRFGALLERWDELAEAARAAASSGRALSQTLA